MKKVFPTVSSAYWQFALGVIWLTELGPLVTFQVQSGHIHEIVILKCLPLELIVVT
jgi:hypothetical protein